MKKKWYNLPRITLVLLLFSTMIGTLYLYQYAPARANTIGNATIQTGQTTHLVLNGNQFHCPNTDSDLRTLSCTIELEGKPLEMALNTTQGIGSTITSCETRYGGLSVACRGSYTMRYGGPIVIIEETLGISEARYGQLRQHHWVDQLNERTWLRLTLFLVSLLALNGAILLWQMLSDRNVKPKWQTAVTVFGSFTIFLFLRASSAIILLFQGWID